MSLEPERSTAMMALTLASNAGCGMKLTSVIRPQGAPACALAAAIRFGGNAHARRARVDALRGCKRARRRRPDSLRAGGLRERLRAKKQGAQGLVDG